VTAPTFVDTSAVLAYLDRDTPEHERATVTLHALLDEQVMLVTHSYVVVEASALVQGRLGMAATRDLHDEIEPLLDVQWVDGELHRAGVTAMLAAGRRRASLVDWVSFEIMRRRGIRRAWTFDRDFSERGFQLVTS
jgi:uncharacterized protein